MLWKARLAAVLCLIVPETGRVGAVVGAQNSRDTDDTLYNDDERNDFVELETKEPEEMWETLLLVRKESNQDPLNLLWSKMKGEEHPQGKTLKDLIHSYKNKSFRSSLINRWNESRVEKVKLGVYNEEAECLSSVTFNGSGSTVHNWFNMTRYLTDMHQTLPPSSTNFYWKSKDLTQFDVTAKDNFRKYFMVVPANSTISKKTYFLLSSSNFTLMPRISERDNIFLGCKKRERLFGNKEKMGENLNSCVGICAKQKIPFAIMYKVECSCKKHVLLEKKPLLYKCEQCYSSANNKCKRDQSKVYSAQSTFEEIISREKLENLQKISKKIENPEETIEISKFVLGISTNEGSDIFTIYYNTKVCRKNHPQTVMKTMPMSKEMRNFPLIFIKCLWIKTENTHDDMNLYEISFYSPKDPFILPSFMAIQWIAERTPNAITRTINSDVTMKTEQSTQLMTNYSEESETTAPSKKQEMQTTNNAAAENTTQAISYATSQEMETTRTEAAENITQIISDATSSYPHTENISANLTSSELTSKIFSKATTSTSITTEKQMRTLKPSQTEPTITTEGTTQMPKLCKCECTKKVNSVNITVSQMKKRLREIEKELTVEKTTTAAYVRKKTSAPDKRPSAQTMGFFGVIILFGTLAWITVPDLITFTYFIINHMRKL